MDLKVEVYQFLSRSNISKFTCGNWTTYPVQRPDIGITIDFQVCDKPFEINFSHIIAKNPSQGPHEYIDPFLDKYMSKRWPKCIKGTATVSSSASDLKETDMLKNILLFLRKFLWERNSGPEFREFINQTCDQTATTLGYRREYFSSQMFDAVGNRRPSNIINFIPTDIGEYVGPGIAHLPDIRPFENVNELVWSWIIPFQDRSNVGDDLQKIEGEIRKTKLHFNSYRELEDARRYLDSGEIRTCVRCAANSVDAILRYYCNAWRIKFPANSFPFDEKIEEILDMAKKPSYKKVASENLEKLLFLYRSRNSSHEGDCSYKDRSGTLIEVTYKSQAEDFVRAAEDFTLWIDSMV